MAFGRDWLRERMGLHFAMALHPRLGARSPAGALDVDVVRLILDLL
jgi:hypothetical protein